MPAKYQIIYWRDIPSQVVCVDGERRESGQLSPRFQEAIDRVAMTDGSFGNDEYLAEWRKSRWTDSDMDVQRLYLSKTAELESLYGPDRMKVLVANKGRELGQEK